MSPATLNSLHVAVLLKIAVIAMSFNLVPLDLGAGENGALAILSGSDSSFSLGRAPRREALGLGV